MRPSLRWPAAARCRADALAAIVAGGLVRAGAVRLVHGLAIAGAQATRRR